jgi:hypothetical protein
MDAKALLEDPSQIELISTNDIDNAPPPNAPHNWADYVGRFRSTSRTIVINSWVVVALSVLCAVFMSVVLGLNGSLTWERRVLLFTIVGVVLAGIQVVLCVSRKEPNTLIIFTTISAIVTGLCMGQIVCYI